MVSELELDYVDNVFHPDRLKALQSLNRPALFFIESVLGKDLGDRVHEFLVHEGYDRAPMTYLYRHDDLPTIGIYHTLLAPVTLRGSTLFGAVISENSVSSFNDRMLEKCMVATNNLYKFNKLEPVKYIAI